MTARAYPHSGQTPALRIATHGLAGGKPMTAADRVRVLIIDSDRRVRQALRELLTAEPDLEVCGTAGTPAPRSPG